jgi:alpha-glucosidase
VSLRAEVDGDGYPEFAREAFHLVLHGAAPEAVAVDGDRLAVHGRVVIPNTGTAFTAEFVV